MTVDKLRLTATKSAELPSEIKTEIDKLDQKLKNISELQRHLGTLDKTKDIHKQYREADVPEQFYQGNRKTMDDNAAAKRYFQDSGYGRWGEFEVPKFADTQRQYAKTLADKNKLWARYHLAKNHNKDAINAWANIKTLLNVPDEIELAPKATSEITSLARKRGGSVI